MRRISVLLLSALLVSAVCLTAQDSKPNQPVSPPQVAAVPAPAPSAVDESVKPVAVAMEDMNAIAGAMVAVQGLQIAIVTLQKELDSANAESQRALARAQAKHPNMPINTKTWVYMPASKTEAPTPGGRR